ncbi:MAG: TIM barrel protein [Cyclobacteriaceae bacterium]|nr:TIM barrel protein [Cyclobacteriaceae bacterium]
MALTSGATLFSTISYPFSPMQIPTSDIACQQYTWYSYFLRENKNWMENPETSMEAFLSTGLRGYEPSFNGPKEVSVLHQQLNRLGITHKSMYVNSVLHEPLIVEENIGQIVSIAREAVKAGIKILVTNPTPINWNGKENKTDDQLKTQAIALNHLGEKLKAVGMTLAYHNHDAEMRESAREFHHMLTGTDPAVVKLCLDAHWIYRGSGNSQVALFDIVEMYASRVVELHIRQSHNGIWSEVFEGGDIDYARLAGVLKKKMLKPHLVLEQAAENGTPHTMDAVAAIRKSLENARLVFSDLL